MSEAREAGSARLRSARAGHRVGVMAERPEGAAPSGHGMAGCSDRGPCDRVTWPGSYCGQPCWIQHPNVLTQAGDQGCSPEPGGGMAWLETSL